MIPDVNPRWKKVSLQSTNTLQVYIYTSLRSLKTSQLYIPVFAGLNGSAIENFSCVIYNISLMKCTWQAGRDAPGDTQYFLYWQNSRDNDVMECELYIKDENGRNMGCRFQNVMIKTERAYFLVNGSSKDSPIQFYDEYIGLYKIGDRVLIHEKESSTLPHLKLTVRDWHLQENLFRRKKTMREIKKVNEGACIFVCS
uniref:Type I cytokine receptor cytokine-binding domain-containing protein n=1 Tax=Strix occidentalis caurina TaxID=311401 RepID=A0A8D0EZZ6_STROC